MNTSKFVDTHAHYNMPAFAGDLPSVIDSVRAAGVGKIICPAVSYASNTQMLTSLAGVPDVYFALGVHPKLACPRKATTDAPPEHATMLKLRVWHMSRIAVINELEGQVESLRPVAESSGHVVAIGEAGLDYSLNPSEFERMAQVALFRAQIKLALQLRLPLVLHIRDAHSDAVDVLRKYRGAAKGVVHCFSAGLREADEYLDLGLHLGIGGRVTHMERTALRNVVAKAPDGRLLLETDPRTSSPGDSPPSATTPPRFP